MTGFDRDIHDLLPRGLQLVESSGKCHLWPCAYMGGSVRLVIWPI
jgi:hypothetical protein